MAKPLDDHHKARLQNYHRKYRLTRLNKIIERAEREALVEEMHAELEELGDGLDGYEEGCEFDPHYKELCQRLRFAARRLVVREFLRIEDEGRKWFFAKYARELGPLETWPKQWMLDSVKIMRNLDRKKNSLFIPLMNYLCKRHMNPQRSHRVAAKIGAGRHNTGGAFRDYVIVKPLLDKDAVATALGTSPRRVYRYLGELCRWGIVKDLGRYSKLKPKVYAVGYYVEFQPGKVRPVWFLKNSKEMRQALREFDP